MSDGSKSGSLDSLTDILNDLNSVSSESCSVEDKKDNNKQNQLNGCGRRFSDFRPDESKRTSFNRSLSISCEEDRVIKQFLSSFTSSDDVQLNNQVGYVTKYFCF